MHIDSGFLVDQQAATAGKAEIVLNDQVLQFDRALVDIESTTGLTVTLADRHVIDFDRAGERGVNVEDGGRILSIDDRVRGAAPLNAHVALNGERTTSLIEGKRQFVSAGGYRND